MRSAEAGSSPRPRQAKVSRTSSTASISACALRLPAGVTARVYSFSTSARPSLTWRTSMRTACITSSGSKPVITTGVRWRLAAKA